jgi:hypothetical protein
MIHSVPCALRDSQRRIRSWKSRKLKKYIIYSVVSERIDSKEASSHNTTYSFGVKYLTRQSPIRILYHPIQEIPL